MIDHNKTLKLYNDGKTDEEISEITGERKKNIQNWRYRNKLKNNVSVKVSGKRYVVDDVKALNLYMSGSSDTQISEILGCSHESVRRWRDLNEYPTNQPIFSWQRLLKPSRFEKIPERYRDPKLWGACR